MWQAFLAWLASLAADPVALDREAPRAAAAVAAAYASLVTDAKPAPTPEPGPQPKPGDCCKECGGKGYIVHGDGHRTACQCPPTCPCKATLNKATCPDGTCPTPRASPASGAPARPAGGR